MKLWRATVEVEVFIASEDEPSDFDIRGAAADEIDDNGAGDVFQAEEVERLADIPPEWRDTLPYGDADDKTCEEIYEAAKAARLEKAYNSPLPNQKELPLE